MSEENENRLLILEIVYNLVELLMTNDTYDEAQIKNFIDSVRDNFDELIGYYEQAAPVGAEGIRELMKEALTSLDDSFAEIEDFLGDLDEDRLRKAVELAEDANDLLEAAEEVIQTNKDVLSQLVPT